MNHNVHFSGTSFTRKRENGVERSSKIAQKIHSHFFKFFAYTKMHSRFWAICIAELISGSGWALEMDFGVFCLMIYFHLFCHFE